MASWLDGLAESLLPVGLSIVGSKLVAKDKNTTGADDAWGQVMLKIAPIAPSFISNSTVDENATLKAMRAVEEVARAYRLAAEARERNGLAVSGTEAL